MMQSPFRRAVVAVLAAALAAPILAGVVPGLAQESKRLRFAPGSWSGALQYQAQASFPDAGAEVNQEGGTFTADIGNGGATGTFHVQVSGVSASDVGGASLTIVVDGDVTGSDANVVLEGTSGSVDGTATVEGITVPIGAPFSADELGPAELVIETASACQVAGEWGFEVPPAVAAAGGTVAINGRWAAIRADGSEDRTAVVTALLARADAVVAAAAGGQLDANELLEVLSEAEALAASLQAQPECGPKAACNLVISDVVADLLESALGDPTAFTTPQLQDLLLAGIRACVFSGGIAPDRARDISDAFHDELESRLGGASGSEVGLIHDIAITGGWNDIASDAEETGGADEISLKAKQNGAGAHPRLRWDDVEGATEYVVLVTRANGKPYWATSGAETEVRFGGGPLDAPDDSAGAALTKKMSWQVMAYDADGALVGSSSERPIAP
jgi:hypothetical protein